MTPDHFEATFLIGIDRDRVWKRLTEHPLDPEGSPVAGAATHCWLPGFDSSATIVEEDAGRQLRLTKDDEPCAGTDIAVTLEDAEGGTRITVVQSRFGDWMPRMRDVMAVGWRHIVADLETYLCTGVHARRHLRAWGDLGADVTVTAGGLRVDRVRDDMLAQRLGLQGDDLLVVLAGAPVSGYDDLTTVLRVLGARPAPVEAEWVRDGTLHTATATAAA